MMKKILYMEFGRAFKNKLFLLSVVLGCAITISHFIQSVLPYIDSVYLPGAQYPLTVFHKWIGGEDTGFQPTLYYFAVPLIIAIPYLWTIKSDMDTGYVKNIFIRIGQEKYYFVKYIVTFVSSGLLAVIPLVVNFLLTAMVLPATIPQSSTAFYPIYNVHILGDLFYERPYVYLLFYLVLNFVYFGLLATTGLVICFVAENRYVVILVPFLIYMAIYTFTLVTDLYEYCPVGFLKPSQPVVSNMWIIGGEIFLLLLSGVVYMYLGSKKEMY